MFRPGKMIVCYLLTVLALLVVTTNAYTCHGVGTQKVTYDPACSDPKQSHIGCNAGGEGINCRFCNAVPEKCKPTTPTPKPKPTTPKFTGTTTQYTGTYPTTTMYNPGNMTLIWQDDFDFFDFSKWKHELTMSGGSNSEFEWYVNNRSNSYVDPKEGVLHIRPTLTEDAVDIHEAVDFYGGQPADLCTMEQYYGCMRDPKGSGNVINPIRSVRFRTAEHFNFRYGRVEIRARLPKGDWLWPAIWMLPRDNEYGDWPESGEIDIVESRGNGPSYSAGGVNQFASTLHFGPVYNQDAYETAHKTHNLDSGDFSDDFHTFGLLWTEQVIQTYIDTPDNIVLNINCAEQSFWDRGKFPSNFDNPWKYSSQTCAPFDKKMYFILNLAVGGTGGYFPEGVGGKPWSNTASNSVNQFWGAKGQWLPTWDMKGDKSSLLIDYIRVWQ